MGLDKLLKLPDSFEEPPTHSAETASKWRQRFREAETQLADARRSLQEAQDELEQLAQGAGAQWQVAPPGATNTNPEQTPVSFRLRAEIRKRREAVAAAERDLRDLGVAADLAKVPPEWRAWQQQGE
ncbi:MAG: hypothetical protein MJE66_04395 [Proteobacteria bacterium]|nr:hypothetical protein [Pseudomonadota bacterium]